MNQHTALQQYVEQLQQGRFDRGLGEGVVSLRDYRRFEQWFHAGITLGWIFECLDEVKDSPTFNRQRCWANLEKRVLEGWSVYASLPKR